MQIIAYFPDKRKEENEMEKMIDVFDLENRQSNFKLFKINSGK